LIDGSSIREVPRPALHETDTMLDAAQQILLADGARAATIEAIAAASGAPTGSIYHRFRSRDELIARIWIRAVRRSQAVFLDAIEGDDPREAAVRTAMSILDFCEEHPADARLLVTYRQQDLVRAISEGPIHDELEELNRPLVRAVGNLSRRLFRKRSRKALERTIRITFDLPYGAARRHLLNGTRFPPGLRADVERAVRAVLDAPRANSS
jgi:AcrR family transcriptional regulator